MSVPWRSGTRRDCPGRPGRVPLPVIAMRNPFADGVSLRVVFAVGRFWSYVMCGTLGIGFEMSGTTVSPSVTHGVTVTACIDRAGVA